MNTLIFIGMLVIITGVVLRLMDEAPLIDTLLIIGGTIVFFFGHFIADTPTAMDVYREKTTLEITYKNGVAIDSVVVFKDKEN
jgi:hypothetical protein